MSNNLQKQKSEDTGIVSSLIKKFPITKIIVPVAAAVIFAIGFPIACNMAGNSFGSTVGTAVGTFHAITEDMPAAYTQGKEDGLSAKDVKVGMGEKIREIGKLDVLAANTELTDIIEDGDKYAALMSFGADVVYSVDLTKAKVIPDGNYLLIRLPYPTASLNIKSTESRIVDEYSKFIDDGSTEDGMKLYINSLTNIKKKAEEKLENKSDLITQAIRSAKKQIKMMAGMIAGKQYQIDVEFEGKEGEKE